MDNNKPHIDTSQVAVSVTIDTPKSATTYSPLPNLPTFIKLFGQPEKKSKEEENKKTDDKTDSKTDNKANDKTDNKSDDKSDDKTVEKVEITDDNSNDITDVKPKSEILDMIDATDEDPFTLETFISLIMLYVKKKKDFLIARVKTVDPNDENKFYYSYYAAHHINKVIFRTQPEQSLLHRMRAKNPLNNMTIVDDVFYYVVKYEDAKKVIENIKKKTKVKDNDIMPKSPLYISPIRIVDLHGGGENNTEEADQDNKHHIRSKSSPIKFVSSISNKAPRSVQRLLVRTGMAPLEAYPELMTRNNLRLIMKPEGLESNPIVSSATIGNDEFNSDDLLERATRQNNFISRIKSTLGKKNETVPQTEVIHEVNDSLVALLTETDKVDENSKEEENSKNSPSSSEAPTDKPSIIITDSSNNDSSKAKNNYSQHVIDLGNTVMSNDKSSPKSAISSLPYPAYSNNLLKIHTNSYLNERNNKLSIYDWIKIHSTSPLSANNERINNLMKKFDKDLPSASSDSTKTKDTAETRIDVDSNDAHEETKKLKEDIMNEINEIIFEAPFYATDDDFLMKSSVRAYFKQNALEPDDAVLFTLPNLMDNYVMLDGEQHPALANFNYVLDRQMQNETRVLRKINKSLKWLLLAYLVFAFVLIKVWVPTSIIIIIIAIGIFLICFFLMICAI